MKLEPNTIKLIEDTFQNEKCCVCQRAAQRFSRNKFYCHEHHPGKKTRVEIKVLRSPKLSS